MPTHIHEHLLHVSNQIIAAEQRYKRPPHCVKLIAVSKSQNVQDIQKAIDAGQYAFGESYVQEAIKKIHYLQNSNIQWHFLGGIQSNKIKLIAENFHWLHSLSSLKVAAHLNHYRSVISVPLNVCIQVNVDKEPSKTGIYLENLVPFAKGLEKFPNLNLRGLMAIPKKRLDFLAQRAAFKKLRIAFIALQQLGLKIDTLSIGMSEDFIAAIAEGATHIRLGTAIFAKRTRS